MNFVLHFAGVMIPNPTVNSGKIDVKMSEMGLYDDDTTANGCRKNYKIVSNAIAFPDEIVIFCLKSILNPSGTTSVSNPTPSGQVIPQTVET